MALSDAEVKMIVRAVGSSRLKSLRLSHGLSQVDMAAKIGVSEKSYRNYELGHRDLPQSTRLKVIWEFQVDLTPTEQLFNELVLPQAFDSAESKRPSKYGREFWKNLRAECCLHRKIRYSRPAQNLLHYRDQLYFIAIVYFTMKYFSVQLGLPFGVEINGIDWVFIGSALILVLLPISILPEFPLFKIAQHYLCRKGNA